MSDIGVTADISRSPPMCLLTKADTKDLRRYVCFLVLRRSCESEDLILPGPPDGSHFPAASAAAEERVAAVGLEARHGYAGRHVELFQNLAGLRIDSAQFAFSASHVPCQSSPSTQVTPVTKRFDSMVRRIAPVCERSCE